MYKIRTKDGLIRHLLYERNGKIMTGIIGDSDITENLSKPLIKKVKKLLR